MNLSIVIPTFNRLEVFKRVLTALETQEGHKGSFEVIVVDDGSDDGTWDYLSTCKAVFPLKIFRQENSGPAKARNVGMAHAEGDRIAFIGDDTIPRPNWVAEHEMAVENHGDVAVLGFTTWDPALKVTPFMAYINDYGLQFGYVIIEDPGDVPFNFFYTSNISLPLPAIREAGGFDETFPFAAWEDVECAYRMMKGGLKMVYRPEAVVQHNHPTTMASFAVRQFKSGIAAATMFERHPDLAHFLGVHLAVETSQNRPLGLKVKDRLCRLLEPFSLFRPHRWYRQIMENHYLRGLASELLRRRLMEDFSRFTTR